MRHQEKLQGKVNTKTEFASAPQRLWKVPLVVTANYTTRNRDLLEHNDFLANPDNRVVVECTGAPGQQAAPTEAATEGSFATTPTTETWTFL